MNTVKFSFRPLIRGLSISSQVKKDILFAINLFPSPHPGIINFFLLLLDVKMLAIGFRPLIRGLSISSDC